MQNKTTMATYRNGLYTMALIVDQSNRVSPSVIPCPSDNENASATQFNAASWSPAWKILWKLKSRESWSAEGSKLVFEFFGHRKMATKYVQVQVYKFFEDWKPYLPKPTTTI